jgi:hypothetical protein
MSDVTDVLLDGLLAREEEEGASINWAGEDFPCSAGTENTGKMLGQGGFRLTAEATLVVRTSVFPNGTGLPVEEQTLTYKSTPDAAARPLRIKNIIRWRGAVMVLMCSHPSQAA